MKLDHVVVQQPTHSPAQLFLLFHGAGDNPVSMGEIGSWFADSFPQALVVSVGAPETGSERGRQWYSTEALDDAARQYRIDAMMESFVTTVRHWQDKSGVRPEATALIGFSQGSIMALESSKVQPELAGRIVAFSGRFATLPQTASKRVTIHLIHGDYDDDVPLSYAQDAEARLLALGGDVTLNVVEDLVHAIDHRGMQHALDHLHYTVPKRYFDEALSGSTPGDDDVITMM